jgi:adenylate cyclase
MKHTEDQKSRWTGLWISLTLTFLVVIFYILSRPEISVIPAIPLLEVNEAKMLDLRFRLRGVMPPGAEIVIVAEDQKTEDELGRWHSSGRQWLAQLIEKLTASGAKVIGLDLILSEPDRGAALEIVDLLKKRYEEVTHDDPAVRAQLLQDFDNARAEHDYDAQLANAIKKSGRVILGMAHYFDPNLVAHLTPEQKQATQQQIRRVRYPTIKFPPGATSYALQAPLSFDVEANLPVFSDAANSFGHLNFVLHNDGYLRRMPLLIEYENDYYPAFALEVARTYLNPPTPPTINSSGGKGRGSIDSIQLAGIRIPTDEHGGLLINYYGPDHLFPYYPLSEVLLGKTPPLVFKDKIVLVGFTSLSAHDVHSTPFQMGTYPGVEVHATLIENILRKDFLTKPGALILIDSFLLLLLGLAMGFVLPQTRALAGLVILLLCLLSVAGIAHLAFLFPHVWLNVTFPLILVLLDYIGITCYKLYTLQN